LSICEELLELDRRGADQAVGVGTELDWADSFRKWVRQVKHEHYSLQVVIYIASIKAKAKAQMSQERKNKE
jgi:fructose-1,6-bisphosphatase